MVYFNLKHKTLYEVVSDVIDATNASNSRRMLLYRGYQHDTPLFVRERKEFHEKFKRVIWIQKISR